MILNCAYDDPEIRYVNFGPSSYNIDSIRSQLDSMIVLGSLPSLPTTLAENDTLVVQARICRASLQQYRDTLTFYGAVVGGCDDDLLFPFTWAVTDSCFIMVALKADTVSIGGNTRITALVKDAFALKPPSRFTANIRYLSKNLYVAPSTSDPKTSIDFDGDYTILKVETDWIGGDTIFTVDALGLLSTSNSTIVFVDSVSISNGNVACKTRGENTTISINDVCATRYLRNIQFTLPNVTIASGSGYVDVYVGITKDGPHTSDALTLSVFSIVGTEIARSSLSTGRTRVDVPPGLYIVQITRNDGLINTRLVLAY